MFDRITFDPKIMGGRACIRGMRIPVSVIVGQVARGAAWEEILDGYPDLEREDVQQPLEYAAWLTYEENHERTETLADIHQAVTDLEAGRGDSLDEAAAIVRERLRLMASP